MARLLLYPFRKLMGADPLRFQILQHCIGMFWSRILQTNVMENSQVNCSNGSPLAHLRLWRSSIIQCPVLIMAIPLGDHVHCKSRTLEFRSQNMSYRKPSEERQNPQLVSSFRPNEYSGICFSLPRCVLRASGNKHNLKFQKKGPTLR